MVPWWKDPAVEARLAVVHVDVAFLLLGVFGWEYFMFFGIEYGVIRGRLPFRWPLVPYLLGRLFLLTTLVLVVIELSAPSENWACQAGMTSVVVSAQIATGCSSTNFMIRSWVMWKNSYWVHILLVFSALGHWTILILVNIKAIRSTGTCTLYLLHPGVTAGVFMYTVCYDLLVLILSVIKLSKQPSKSPLEERLRMQGFSYFAIATMANIVPTVFAFLGADAMVGITGNFAITLSAIVSCRAVRSLLGLNTLRERNEDIAVLTTQLPDQSSILQWMSPRDLQDEHTAC